MQYDSVSGAPHRPSDILIKFKSLPFFFASTSKLKLPIKSVKSIKATYYDWKLASCKISAFFILKQIEGPNHKP